MSGAGAKLYFLPAEHAPLHDGRLVRKARFYGGSGTEFIGIQCVSIRPADAHEQDGIPDALVCNVEMLLAPGECVKVDKPPPRAYATLEELSALVASWRAHWAVAQPDGDDCGSDSLDAGMERCADELEALIETLTARQG